MSVVISRGPVGAILRQSPTGSWDLGQATGDFDREKGRGLDEKLGYHLDREDPLGLRDAWIKTREAVKRIAVQRKSSSGNRQKIAGNKGLPPEERLEKIKDKVAQMREDLGRRLMEGNHGRTDGGGDVPQQTDLPDKEIDQILEGIENTTMVKYQDLPLREGSLPSYGEELGCIKNRAGATILPHLPLQATNTKSSSAMADRDSGKNKAPMISGEEVGSNDKPGLGSRPMQCGGSSSGRGDLYRSPAGQRVAHVFPVNMGAPASNVVELNLSREREAMRSRWIAVGLFFSVQLFSIGGLFGELRGKWGLRGRLSYTSLKNNRFPLEFEREGDLRFILNNGPLTHKGDAFLRLEVDGSAWPGDVEVAHMPIWERIFDAPPIMLFEHVARELDTKLGKVLEVDADRDGRIWGDYMRVRINHDVDEPFCSELESHDLAKGKVYVLNVKYERLPRFYTYCGHLGHGQHDCKLPEDLQEMRFSTALRSSPFRRSSIRGGIVVPESV